MAWTKAFNFRDTSGYVTDVDPETYAIETDTFPTIRNGVTFGFQNDDADGTNFQDRSAAANRRWAGCLSVNPTVDANGIEFVVTLPAIGSYMLRMAVGGDPGFSSRDCKNVAIYDNASLLLTVATTSDAGATSMWDILGNRLDFTTWPGSNASSSQTFATTTLKLKIGYVYFQTAWLNHLWIDSLAPPNPFTFVQRKLRPRPFAPGLAR